MDIKKLWNILCLLLVANIAFGAQVTGKVIDKGTMKAIDFANVSVVKVQGDNVQSTKVLENGVLYIIKNGVRYNAQGQAVK